MCYWRSRNGPETVPAPKKIVQKFAKLIFGQRPPRKPPKKFRVPLAVGKQPARRRPQSLRQHPFNRFLVLLKTSVSLEVVFSSSNPMLFPASVPSIILLSLARSLVHPSKQAPSLSIPTDAERWNACLSHLPAAPSP